MQEKGQDIYADTRDIIVTPPIFTLRPQEKRIIRVSQRITDISDYEKAYRLYLQQISSNALEKDMQYGLRLIVNISIPIFIAPETVQKDFIWQLKKIDDHQLQLVIENKSNIHIQCKQLTLFNAEQNILWDQNVFAYILPNQKKIWIVNISEPLDVSQNLQLIANTDLGELREDDIYVQ